jgi:hypothetical protein
MYGKMVYLVVAAIWPTEPFREEFGRRHEWRHAFRVVALPGNPAVMGNLALSTPAGVRRKAR